MGHKEAITARTGTTTQLVIFLGVVGGYAAWMVFPALLPKAERAESLVAVTPAPAPAAIEPLDAEAIQVFREAAWPKLEHALAAADQSSQAELQRSVARIRQFITDRKAKGSAEFCNELLSLKGKWELIYAQRPFAKDDSYYHFLNAKFEEKLFRMDDLKEVVGSAAREYAIALQALENQLLVQCRADLDAAHPLARRIIPELASAETFRTLFEDHLRQSQARFTHEVAYSLSTDVASFMVMDVVANIVIRMGTMMGTYLGVDAGILTAGASSSWATLGIGLVAAVVVDIGLDWFLRLIGEDVHTRLAEKVGGTLDRLANVLIDGEPKAVEHHRRLLEMAVHDPYEPGRAKFQDCATRIENSGHLGLRHELERLHQSRADLRKAALQHMIFSGDTP